MRAVVCGAGVAGLATALALARDGHEVVVLERDAIPEASAPEEAFSWQRRGAPQVHHSHAFLARLRNLLRDRLPDVRDDLLAAGATELTWSDMAPDTIDDRSACPGDEDLVMLACRRTTFEWILRCAALRTERVEVRDRTVVEGLLTERHGGNGAPMVSGVRTGAGDVRADLVVDAMGRTSKLPSMLADHGVQTPEEQRPSWIVYLSRFYRLLPGAAPAEAQALNGGDLGHTKYAVFRADNRTFSVTLAFDDSDTELRGLRDVKHFDEVIERIPGVRPWVEPDRSEPITAVHFMGGLINRVRRLVVDGEPCVLGIAAVGDAAVCTNPLYGRGCALGSVHAFLLADAFSAADGDPVAAARAFSEATERELVPWYTAAVAQDEVNRKVQRGEPLEGQTAFLRSVLGQGLLPAARIDASVNRAWFRTFNLLVPPDSLMNDGAVVNRVFEVWQERGTTEPELAEGPSRDEILALLG